MARNTKNGRDHTLPLTTFVFNTLFERSKQKKNEFVFPARTRVGYIRQMTSHLNQIIEKCGINFTPHDLRRTFSHVAVREHVGEGERKALLNHLKANDVTDAHYTPWEVEELRPSIQIVENKILRLAGLIS